MTTTTDDENEAEIEAIRVRVLESLARLDAEMEGLTKVLDSPRRLRAVSDVCDRLTDEEIRRLDLIISTAHAASGTKWVALVLLDKDKAQVISSMEQIPTGDRSQSYCQMVVASGKPWSVDNTRKNNIVNRWRSTVEYDVGAYIGVPVTAHGQTIGALCMFQPEPRKWNVDDERLLVRFATDVSAALDAIGKGHPTP